MLSTEIHDAATELGRAVRNAPSVAAYRAAQAALDADPEALALIERLRQVQAEVVGAQRRGQQPTRADLDALRACQADVRASETIMAHLRATNEVKAFLPGIAAEITRALGIDYARLIAPTSC